MIKPIKRLRSVYSKLLSHITKKADILRTLVWLSLLLALASVSSATSLSKASHFYEQNSVLLLPNIGSLSPLICSGLNRQRGQSGQAELLYIQGKVTAVELQREDSNRIVFKVKLSLTFTNSGKRPLIILNRNPYLGAVFLMRSPRDAASHSFVYTSSAWPSISSSPEWGQLRQKLDQQLPSSDLTKELTPGSAVVYETDTALYIEKAGSFDKSSQSWETIKSTALLWLQVELEQWPTNLHRDFGEKLREKWQNVGYLWLDRVISEPMELTLSHRN